MHGPTNVKSLNNTSKWQMGFNSAFKGLMHSYLEIDGKVMDEVILMDEGPEMRVCDVGERGVKRGSFFFHVAGYRGTTKITDVSKSIYFMVIQFYIILNAGGKNIVWVKP
jgi:hypothetical protein